LPAPNPVSNNGSRVGSGDEKIAPVLAGVAWGFHADYDPIAFN
jgi:hypothetical protein